MGIGQNIKDLYFSLEEKYYGVLDKIDTKIPIYKVINPIDKVFPSFVLVIILFLALILGIILMMIPPMGVQQFTDVTFRIENNSGNRLSGLEVYYNYGIEGTTVTTNNEGEFTIVQIPLDSILEINIVAGVVNGKEYNGVEKSYTVDEYFSGDTIILLEKSTGPTKVDIYITDMSGNRIIGKNIEVLLSCENSYVVPVPSIVRDTDNDGKISVDVPQNCGTMRATISATGYITEMFVLLSASRTVKLSAKEPSKGSLKVRVRDDSGILVEDADFVITLYDSADIYVNSKHTLDYGEVTFTELMPGTYSVIGYDTDSRYSTDSEDDIYIGSGSTEEVTLVVTGGPSGGFIGPDGKWHESIGILEVEVIDNLNGERIKNANVELRLTETDVLIEERNTGDDGEIVKFPITEDLGFTLVASHENYHYEIVEVSDLNKLVVIELEKITPENSGIVKIHVIDEDDIAVENAKVVLRFLDNGTLAPYNYKVTDNNGFVEFKGVKPGSYYAYATKYHSYGDNIEDGKEIDVKEITEFTVRIEIGDTDFSITAHDEDFELVEDTEAEFFTVFGESLGVIPLSDGTGTHKLKSDKEVYVVISHDDYIDVQTLTYDLWPDTVIDIDATLKPTYYGNPKIKLLGVFFDDFAVEMLEAGQIYEVVFEVTIPENADYDEFGIHLRAGDDEPFENTPVVIKRANTPNAVIIKGTKYTPPNGYAIDHAPENMVDEKDDGKWINIINENPKSRVYTYSVKIKVKPEIQEYTDMVLHYRAWFKDGDRYIRDPTDDVLGENANVKEKQALYANTYEKLYSEGRPPLCEQEFCYGNEEVLDLETDELYLIEPYLLKIYAEYELGFDLTNDSDTVYENAELYILAMEDGIGSDVLEIKGYEFTNADTMKFSESGIALNSIEKLPLGEFIKGKTVSMKSLVFEPKSLGSSEFEVRIISGGKIIYSHLIKFSVVSNQTMIIRLEPEVIPAYIPNQFIITVTAEENELPIEGAYITLTKTNPNHVDGDSFEAETNERGIAVILDQELSDPGTKIKVEAQKLGYWAEPVTAEISEDIISIEPEEVSASVTPDDGPTYVDFSFENKVGIDLKFSELSLTGNDEFGYFLELEGMKYYLEKWTVNDFITAMETDTFDSFLKIQFRDSSLNDLKKTENAKGILTITFTKKGVGGPWTFEVPVNVTISPAGMPDNEGCLQIVGPKTWDTFTEGSEAKMDFEIENHCIRNTKDIELDNIQAMVKWKGSRMGYVELTIEGNSNVLVDNTWTRAYGTIEGGDSLNALLRFIPNEGFEGETAQFTVFIDSAFGMGASDEKEMINNKAEFIESTVTIANLETCIKYLDKSEQEFTKLVIAKDDSDGAVEFKINIEECGATDVKFILCKGDSHCNGGAEGGIELTPNENQMFTVTSDYPNSEYITVERESIPGMYGIPVYATTPGGTTRKVALIDVEVEPETGEYFRLDKYELNLSEKGDYEAVDLVNEMYIENVTVHANYCSWKEAANNDKTMDWILKGASIGAVFGSSAAIITAMGIGAWAGPVGILLGGLIGLLFSLFGCHGCECKYKQGTLNDYVINLSGGDNEIAKFLDSDLIDDFNISWSTGNPKYGSEPEHASETVALVIEKTSDYEDVKPTYTTMQVSAKEHIHKDETHAIENPEEGSADVYCRNGNFGALNIGESAEEGSCDDISEKTHTQKFHMKINTSQYEEIVAPPTNAQKCSQGTLKGYTGANALPKTELNWSWNLNADACDYKEAGNENYIYCDATQFSIAFTKKMMQLEEFLAHNGQFSCPQNWMMIGLQNSLGDENDKTRRRSVTKDKIGLEEITETINGNTVDFIIKVTNKTSAQQTATVTLTVNDQGGGDKFSRTCEKGITLEKGKSGEVYCNIPNVPETEKMYIAYANIDSETTDNVENTEEGHLLGISFIIWPEQNECFVAKTTIPFDGTPTIEYFINKNNPKYGQYVIQESVQWRDFSVEGSQWETVQTNSQGTEDIQGMDDVINWLRSVTQFKAYLMKDGYSQDFREDFVEYYTLNSFMDAPADFHIRSGGNWADYFEDNEKLEIMRKNINNGSGKYTLQSPGLYEIDVEIDFGDDWTFFENGQPKADIDLIMHNIAKPSRASPFYSLPLNGNVGLDSDNGRQGYGVNYENANDVISIASAGSGNELISTSEIENPNALVTVNTEVNDNFKTINSIPATRGILLSLNENNLTFSPNYATPVLMKVHSEVTNNPFSAIYIVKENETPKDVGSIMTYWNGEGQCLDFSGDSVSTAFRNRADSETNAEDIVDMWEDAYKISWVNGVEIKGDVYLKSVFYTPISNVYELTEIGETDVSFISPNGGPNPTIALRGISGTANNDQSGNQNVSSIAELFTMVSNEEVCITNDDGIETKFWWNPIHIGEVEGYANAGITCVQN
ncbi:MAG: carboxypeptidase-like regulatory domain-containing protein [Candidatus Diapherotrites archaeon]